MKPAPAISTLAMAGSAAARRTGLARFCADSAVSPSPTAWPDCWRSRRAVRRGCARLDGSIVQGRGYHVGGQCRERLAQQSIDQRFQGGSILYEIKGRQFTAARAATPDRFSRRFRPSTARQLGYGAATGYGASMRVRRFWRESYGASSFNRLPGDRRRWTSAGPSGPEGPRPAAASGRENAARRGGRRFR
jgi:hypothetical protein